MHSDAQPTRSDLRPVVWRRRRSAWAFTGVLWVLRWLIILPLNWLVQQFAGPESSANIQLPANPMLLLFLLVFAAPLIETLLECSLPYWALERVHKSVHRWLFIIISASLMALLHMVSLVVVMNALITGGFIAYVYAQHAEHGHRSAILHAFAFHSAINLVGWVLLLSEA